MATLSANFPSGFRQQTGLDPSALTEAVKLAAMTPAEFDNIVYDTVDGLPSWVHEAIDNIDLLIVDEPAKVEVCEGQHDLLGLYVGLPLTERGPSYAGELPDVIYIFRNPHLEMGLPADELREEIAKTLIHEVAHYFGIDDGHLDDIGWG